MNVPATVRLRAVTGDGAFAGAWATRLTDRLGALHLLRLTLGVLAISAVVALPAATGHAAEAVAPATAAYLLVVSATELARRLGRLTGLPVVVALLFADGLWLAMVREATGGPASILSGLVVMHLVAVMLVASARTGLRVALWHGALFLLGYALDLSWGRDPRNANLDITAAEASVSAVGAFLFLAVGTAIFSAVNERELRRSRADMAALADLAAALDRAATVEEVEAEAVGRAVTALQHRRAALLDLGGDGAVVVASPGADVCRRLDIEGPDPELDEVFAKGATRLVAHLDAGRLGRALPDARNVMLIPLLADGEPMGMLALEAGPSSPVVLRHRVDLARQFGSHVALALRSARLHAEVQRLASEDQLTGLANRRVFQDFLDHEIARAARSRQPVGLVMVDADHFKAVNDVHGHQVGDQVLAGLGAVLRAVVREVDLAARYGGEELALVLPGADAVEVAVVGERVRAAVTDADLPVPVTVSLGAASFPEHAGTAATLVEAADRALYASKAEGRNRCTVAEGGALRLVSRSA